MTEPAAMHAHIMDRADFRRARPEYRNPRPGTITKTCMARVSIAVLEIDACDAFGRNGHTIEDATIM